MTSRHQGSKLCGGVERLVPVRWPVTDIPPLFCSKTSYLPAAPTQTATPSAFVPGRSPMPPKHRTSSPSSAAFYFVAAAVAALSSYASPALADLKMCNATSSRIGEPGFGLRRKALLGAHVSSPKSSADRRRSASGDEKTALALLGQLVTSPSLKVWPSV